jgi:anti-anti-sigma factor
MKNLTVGVEKKGRFDVIVLVGELGIEGSRNFKEEFTKIVQQGSKAIAMDLTKVSLFTSVGLSALVRVYETAKQEGIDLRLVCPEGHIRDILIATGSDQMLPPYDSLDDLDKV